MSGLDDGWDNDDDLNLDGSHGGWGDDDNLDLDDEPLSSAPPPPPPPPPHIPSMEYPNSNPEEDGWGDDDNLDLDLDVDDSPAPSARTVPESPPDNTFGAGFNVAKAPPPPPPPRPAIAAAASEENGWGDDDDLDLDEDMEGPLPTSRTVSESPDHTGTSTPTFRTGRTVPESPENQNGWGDDDDLDLGMEKTPAQSRSIPKASQDDNRFGAGFGLPSAPSTPEHEITFTAESNESNDSGWDDDEDLFGDEVVAADTPNEPASPGFAQQMPPPDAKLLDIQQQLEKYVSSLDRIAWSINAVLEFEYNTPEKAQELVDYYSARPQLADYTRTKELPRMDYQVVLPFGHVETDKTEIRAQYLPDESLLSRCANQSLLADLLHQITGPDLIVRPAFLSVCVARWCKFTIHFAGNLGGEDMVDCACRLHLSLPTAEGERLDIAEVTVQIVFKPLEPMVEYRILSIDVLLKDMSKLKGTAQFLNMIEGHFDEFPGHEDVQLQNAPADKYRDAFLENSQKLLTQSTLGMKSALQQMEAVVNLRQKFNIVKGGYKTISKFIPDTDQLLAAEEEARNVAKAREQQLQQHRQNRIAPPTPPQGPPPGVHPRHPQPGASALAPPPPSEASRPTSILGGIVSSGWSALAKSIAIPDEDPAPYGAAPSQTEQQPTLYRTEPAAPIDQPPSVYNRHETPPPQFPRPSTHTEERPALYRTEHAVPKQQPPPTLYNRSEYTAPPRPGPPSQSNPLEEFHQNAAQTTETVPPRERPAIAKDSESHRPAHASQQEGQHEAGRVRVQAIKGVASPPVVTADRSKTVAPPPPPPAPSQARPPTAVPDAHTESQVSWKHQIPAVASKSQARELEPVNLIQTKPGSFETKGEADEIKAAQPDFDAKNSSFLEEDRLREDVTDVEFSSGRAGENTASFQAPDIPKGFTDDGNDEARRQNQRKPLIADVDYNSDDDIIETCKRWRNPRPYRPYLAI
jgi:hypothetical protein